MIGQERSQNDPIKLPDLKILTTTLMKSCSDMEIKDHELRSTSHVVHIQERIAQPISDTNKNKQELFSSNLSIDNISCEDGKKGSHLYTNDHAFVLAERATSLCKQQRGQPTIANSGESNHPYQTAERATSLCKQQRGQPTLTSSREGNQLLQVEAEREQPTFASSREGNQRLQTSERATILSKQQRGQPTFASSRDCNQPFQAEERATSPLR
ncbi:hypothetical protein CDAR_273471 [Caerostris darwini]|uniref:Uncharacterized protein n=1 Tax=Caerostris darwini TaxID=1538125 RepID=A0AAV4W302_9ARAC|nr:hypothetical protein CDAR_273471 [Caerostris darwini]